MATDDIASSFLGQPFLTLKNLSESLKRSFIFAGGLFPIPIICWFLVLINPGGREALKGLQII